jgi:hypothetical protein
MGDLLVGPVVINPLWLNQPLKQNILLFHRHAESVAYKLRKLVTELGVYKPDHRILIRVDNMGAISTSNNPEQHERTKHFDIRYHYTREEVAAGRVKLAFVRSADNVADGFTKPLPKPAHERFTNRLRLCQNVGVAEGECHYE